MITQQNILGLDDSHLVDCQNQHRLQPEVAEAFARLQQAAKADGIDCQIASSYRGFAQQKSIWQKKWTGQKALLDINEVPLDIASLSDMQKLQAILRWSALPGTSRHHWGTDFDVYDHHSITQRSHRLQLVQSEYCSTNGPCFELNNWLTEHAQQHGFVRPYQHYVGGVAAEPWHLSYQPLAKQISSMIDVTLLKQTLVQQQIAGVELVLANFDLIFQCFILNKGQQTG